MTREEVAALPLLDDGKGQPSLPGFETRRRCPVCREFVDELEMHHTAPKEIFGAEEAERWPLAACCRACHEHWHQKMGCPIGDHRAGLSANEPADPVTNRDRGAAE